MHFNFKHTNACAGCRCLGLAAGWGVSMGRGQTGLVPAGSSGPTGHSSAPQRCRWCLWDIELKKDKSSPSSAEQPCKHWGGRGASGTGADSLQPVGRPWWHREELLGDIKVPLLCQRGGWAGEGSPWHGLVSHHIWRLAFPSLCRGHKAACR